MPTIDVQVHVYERNHAGRPWAAVLHGPAEVTGDQMIAAMDAVGVDGAIMVSPYTQYRYDASYALEVYAKYPKRFAVVKPVDPTDPKVGDTIADWKKMPGAVGIRIMMAAGPLVAPDDAGVNCVLAEAARQSLPVNVLSWGRLEQIGPLAARNPNTRIVIDHLGILQPFEPPKPAEPWAALPTLLDLAKYDNVVVKISGADEQAQLIEQDPARYARAAYFGDEWIALRLDLGDTDWDAVAQWIARSWRAVAPARLTRLLDAADQF